MADDKQVEAVDHRAEANRLLGEVTPGARSSEARIAAEAAQVHATLALADEVRELRQSLGGDEIKDALIGEIQHVGREFIEIFWRANRGRN